MQVIRKSRVVVACAVAWVFMARAAAEPVPVAMPGVLLRLPVSSVPLALQANGLPDRGFAGAILYGDAKTSEADAALRQLTSGGLRLNALEFRLDPPVEALLAGAEDPAYGARVSAAVNRARKVGAQGLAIEPGTRAACFDPGFYGYAAAGLAPDQVAVRVRALGEMAGHAALRGSPALDVFLIADFPARPLWWAWLDGFLLEAARASDAHVHLLVRFPNTLDARVSFASEFRRVDRMIRAQVGDASWEAWNQCGSIVPLLDAGDSGDARQQVLIAAKLQSPAFVCCDIPGKSSDALQTLTVAVPSIDEYARAGVLEALGGEVHVLGGTKGAVLVALTGIAQPLVLRDRSTSVSVTQLETGVREERAPEQGVVTVAATRAPVLIEGLPVRDWVYPAAMWLDASVPLVDGTSRTPVRYGWTNCGDAVMGGSFAAVPSARFSILPDAQHVALEPGARYEAHGVLTGAARAGDRVSLRLVFGVPGAAPIVRSFALDVAPRLKWHLNTFAPSLQPWIATQLDAGPSHQLCGVTEAGTLLCVDATGQIRWQKPSSAFASGCAVGRYWNDREVLATVDSLGTVHVFDGYGGLCWKRALGAPPGTAPVFANLNPKRGEEVVAGLVDGSVVALRSDGEPLWRVVVDAPVQQVLRVDRNGDGRNEIVAVSGKSVQQMTLIDALGRVVWEQRLSAPLRAAPITDDSGGVVILGLSNGHAALVNASDGAVVRDAGIAPDAITTVRCASARDGVVLFYTTANAICAATQDQRVLWTSALHVTGTPAVAGLATGYLLLVPTAEGITALDDRGNVLWCDTRAGAAVTGTPFVGDADNDGASDCVYMSADGIIRAIEIPAR